MSAHMQKISIAAQPSLTILGIQCRELFLAWSGVSDHIHVDELKRCIYKYLNTYQKSCQEFIYQLILKI